MMRGCGVAAVASLGLIACAAGAQQTQRYDGLCEASAAVALDGKHFVVASDDSKDLLIYERGKPAGTVALTLQDGLGKVTDIEAAARIGDTIFWLTSHSRNKAGEDKPGRQRLFATEVKDRSLTPVGTPPADFRRTVLTVLALEDDAIGTFNIEGLAATADGALLVGLRAPLAAGDGAYVARVDDARSLVGLGTGKPPVTRRFVLPLGGRGIRSIERVGDAFLIVAGPSGDTGGPGPTLFWWDGLSETVTPGPVVPALGKITPEALIAWGPNDVQILGDNEQACSDKAPGPKWFPSIHVRF